MNRDLNTSFSGHAAATPPAFSSQTLFFIALSLALGVLFALAFGLLHRADIQPGPLSPPARNTVKQALMRAGQVLLGSTGISLATLMATPKDASALIALAAVICGLLYGFLASERTTVRTAIWKGAQAFAAVSTAGHALLTYWLAR